MKTLITRFGGVGDNAPMTVVGTQLKKRGHDVTFACREDGKGMIQAEMFAKNPSFDNLLSIRQVGPWRTRCIKSQMGYIGIDAIYKDFDNVIDYMNIIEGNSTCNTNKGGPENVWQKSRNSNWTNWYDLHLAWANIDPTSVPNDEKRPVFTLLDEEQTMFSKFKQNFDKLIVLQTSASSLSRTWYAGKTLVGMLKKEFPKACIVIWDAQENAWVAVTSNGMSKLDNQGYSPLRFSMALVGASDCFVGADTGFTHVAEGLQIPHVAIYSTVPAWTRNKYYKFQRHVDPGEKDPTLYTFNLGLGDPLREIEGRQYLSRRELEIEKLYERGVEKEEAAEALNTTPHGADMELKAFITKKHSWEHQQSKALSLVKPEDVLKEVKEIVK